MEKFWVGDHIVEIVINDYDECKGAVSVYMPNTRTTRQHVSTEFNSLESFDTFIRAIQMVLNGVVSSGLNFVFVPNKDIIKCHYGDQSACFSTFTYKKLLAILQSIRIRIAGLPMIIDLDCNSPLSDRTN